MHLKFCFVDSLVCALLHGHRAISAAAAYETCHLVRLLNYHQVLGARFELW